MSYNVLLVESLGAPRNHQVIFIELSPGGAGYIFQVTGDIQTGMTFGHREEKEPEESVTFVGTIVVADFDRIQSIVESVAPPAKQFDGPRRIDPTKPLRRCQEWTAEAIQALENAGVLRTG
ncbi:hypothetical protein BDV95DRAFT_566534 [Massariosphaeria phaeospora]|uniref:Uncharacterized protein n=1 Tax=Massariosphaeria phaeospora TaxID=100035 RepID=A0A7C8MBV1_9PLEO|nr:hypothetical protein BDV95DRAFT_566534 [Massariosphaeria phaeospora]